MLRSAYPRSHRWNVAFVAWLLVAVFALAAGAQPRHRAGAAARDAGADSATPTAVSPGELSDDDDEAERTELATPAVADSGAPDADVAGDGAPPHVTATGEEPMETSPGSPTNLPIEPAAAAPFPAGRVVDVVLDPPLEGEDPWARVRLHPGAVLDAAVVRDAFRAALASGTFSEARASVRVIPTGLVLVIRGERRARLQEVAFVGVDERPIENVRADFGLAAGSWASDTDVARAVDRLRQSYRDAGWNNASISSRWRATDNSDRRVLIVTVLEGPQTTIRSVEFEGVPVDALEAVRAAVGISRGDVAEPQAARRAFDAISAALRHEGYLSATRPEVRFVPVGPALVDVVFTLSPGPPFRIAWNGIVWFLPSALEAALRLEEEHTLEATTMVALANRVRDFYLRRGFIDVRVRAESAMEVRPDRVPRAVLRFTVNEGRQTLVRNIEFIGARGVPAEDLHNVLREALFAALPGGEPGDHVEDSFDFAEGYSPGPPPRATARLFPERTYVPDVYADAVQRMIARYHERGFPDATVSAPEVRRVRDDMGRPALDVTFRIHEGPQTMFDELQVEGNHSVASQELVAATNLRLGGPVSYAALDTARTAMVELYRERGFLFARVDPEVDRSPDRTRARVRFVVHEGPEVRVGQVYIRGNIRTRRGIIEQRIAFAPGDLVRPSSVRATQRRLGELGVFSGVTISPIDPNVEAPVKDVLIQVVELRPQFLELRAGYSTGEGIRAGLEYGYRNFAGTGITISLRARIGMLLLVQATDPVFEASLCRFPCLGRLRGGVNLGLLAPAIPAFGPNWRLAGDVGFNRQLERQFAISTVSATASATWRALRQVAITPAAEASVNSLDLIAAQSINGVLENLQSTMPGDVLRVSRLLLLPTGTTTLVVGRIGATLDLRDQPFNPTKGMFANLLTELVITAAYQPAMMPMQDAHAAEPGNTFRNVVSLSGYVPLPFGIVFATSLRGGLNITPGRECNGSNCPPPPDHPKITYPNRQFFLGGADSLRGWNQDTFVPQDVLDACQPPGNCGSLPGLAQRGADLFVTLRNELRIPVPYLGVPVSLGLFLDLGNSWRDPANASFKIRGAAGFGLRYITPIGPIALDFGFNLAPDNVLFPRPASALDTPPGLTPEPRAAFHFSIGTF